MFGAIVLCTTVAKVWLVFVSKSREIELKSQSVEYSQTMSPGVVNALLVTTPMHTRAHLLQAGDIITGVCNSVNFNI